VRGRGLTLPCLLGLLCMGGQGVAGGPERSSASVASVEGIVRVAGVPAVAKVEIRRMPDSAAPPAWLWGAWGNDETEEPTQTGVVQGPALRSVASDERGTYRIDGLAPGRYQLRAAADGATAFAGLAVEGGGALVKDLGLSPGPRTLRGRIRWADGKAFQGTVIVSQPREGRRATPWLDGALPAATDPEGHFRVSGLVAGSVDVAAVVPRRVRVTWTRLEPADTADLDLVIDRGLAESAGRVTSLAGEPIPNVPVVCRTVFDDGTEIAASARADAEGRFRVLAAPGPRRVTAVAPGFVRETTVDAGGEVAARLLRAPVVRGLVRRKDDGKPIDGARVHVSVRTNWGWHTTSGRTDATGRYEVVTTTPGEADVVVQGAEWVAVAPSTTERWLEAGTVTEIDFEAIAAARVLGRVVSEDGAAVAGATVDVRVNAERPEDYRKQAVVNRLAAIGTDHEGRFVVEGIFPDTSVRVSARSPFHPWGGADATPGDFATITLLRRPPIVGRIVLPAGARPSAVWLRSQPERPERDPASPTPPPESPPLSSLDVRADGSFRFEPAEPGPYTLRAGAWAAGIAYEGTAIGAPGKGDALVAMQPAGPTARAWLFRVVDPEGRRVPEGEATVFEGGPGYSGTKWLPIEGGEVTYWSARADSDVSIEVTGYRDAAGRPLPYAVSETDPLAPGVHEIRLRPGRVVRGRLRTPDGMPVGHAGVSAYPIDPAPPDRRAAAWTETGADGRFVLLNLEQRAYEIDVRAPTGLSPVAPTPAPVGSDDVEITILPLVSVRIDVSTVDPRPIVGARVLVWSPTGTGALAAGAVDLRTGVDGSVVLPPLPPMQRFSVRVEPAGDDALATERVDWAPEPTVFRLSRADVLHGVVRDPAGLPIPDATVWVRPVAAGSGALSPERVWWRIRDGFALGGLCTEGGAFSIGRLVPGEVELFAAVTAADGTPRESPPVTTSTSSRDVVLTIPAR
jgi:hypothetical protein